MKVTRKQLLTVLELLLDDATCRAVMLIQSPKFGVRAVRPFSKRRDYRGKRETFCDENRRVQVSLTFGRLNYQERQAAKRAKRKGEKFPLLVQTYAR